MGRNNYFRFNATNEETERIKRIAREKGKTKASHCRESALNDFDPNKIEWIIDQIIIIMKKLDKKTKDR